MCALTASVSPVMALVSPGPWWTLQTPTLPVTRAQESAMVTAAVSWRAQCQAAPRSSTRWRTSWKLPLPTSPKS